MRAQLLVALVAASTVAADSPAGDPAAADREKLRGTWTPAAIERDGKRAGPGDADFENFKGQLFTFDAEKLAFKIPGGVGGDATYRLDPSADPKGIDLTGVGSKSTTKAIYKFDGDALILCRAEPDAARPTEFKTKPGDKVVLYILKRKKD